jgi:hypothetical protein
MPNSELDPIAEYLLTGYSEASIYSRQFKETHKSPPTTMAKVHHMLSVVQALATHGEFLVLGAEYSEYGRVELTSRATEQVYLLRSQAAVSIERSRRQDDALFDSAPYIASAVKMMVHRFHPLGLDLSVAGTRHRAGKKRLEVTGSPTLVGTWLFASDASEAGFDQGRADSFDELGSLDELGETGEP